MRKKRYFLREFLHPFLGQIGITADYKILKDNDVISNAHESEFHALKSLEKYITEVMVGEESSLFEKLKEVQNIKVTRLSEFEKLRDYETTR